MQTDRGATHRQIEGLHIDRKKGYTQTNRGATHRQIQLLHIDRQRGLHINRWRSYTNTDCGARYRQIEELHIDRYRGQTWTDGRALHTVDRLRVQTQADGGAIHRQIEGLELDRHHLLIDTQHGAQHRHIGQQYGYTEQDILNGTYSAHKWAAFLLYRYRTQTYIRTSVLLIQLA